MYYFIKVTWVTFSCIFEYYGPSYVLSFSYILKPFPQYPVPHMLQPASLSAFVVLQWWQHYVKILNCVASWKCNITKPYLLLDSTTLIMLRYWIALRLENVILQNHICFWIQLLPHFTLTQWSIIPGTTDSSCHQPSRMFMFCKTITILVLPMGVCIFLFCLFLFC